MTVYQRLAQAFKAEGVKSVFGIMGDANMYWYSELDKLGVQLVEVRHEGAGLGMADGWARATHKVGVASATPLFQLQGNRGYVVGAPSFSVATR